MHYRIGYHDLSGLLNVSLSSLVKTARKEVGIANILKIIIFLTLSAILFENESIFL